MEKWSQDNKMAKLGIANFHSMDIYTSSFVYRIFNKKILSLVNRHPGSWFSQLVSSKLEPVKSAELAKSGKFEDVNSPCENKSFSHMENAYFQRYPRILTPWAAVSIFFPISHGKGRNKHAVTNSNTKVFSGKRDHLPGYENKPNLSTLFFFQPRQWC